MAPLRILIADDDAVIRDMLRSALKDDGYAVKEAADGRKALAAVERWNPALLLLDLVMPVLDGMDVLVALQQLQPLKRPRVIVLSGHGSIPIVVKAVRLGAMAFLEKPVDIGEVRKSVSAVLAEPLASAWVWPSGADMLAGGYAAVLDRIRAALRMTNYPLAETLLMKVDDLADKNAAYFNLLGIYYESRREWRAARKFYKRAIAAEKRYIPAQINLRRLRELTTLDESSEPIAYGDEQESRFSVGAEESPTVADSKQPISGCP